MKFFKRKKMNGKGEDKAPNNSECEQDEDVTCKEVVQRETAAVLHKAGSVFDSLSDGTLRVRLPKPAK